MEYFAGHSLSFENTGNDALIIRVGCQQITTSRTEWMQLHAEVMQQFQNPPLGLYYWVCRDKDGKITYVDSPGGTHVSRRVRDGQEALKLEPNGSFMPLADMKASGNPRGSIWALEWHKTKPSC